MINDTYLSTFAAGVDTFTALQLKQLTDIANQCPYLGGPAVFTASYLLSHADHVSAFNDSVLCNQYAKKESANELTWPACTIFPNPADNTVFLSYNLAGEMHGEFEMFDELGRRALHINLSQENSTLLLDISQLHPGIYFYRIRAANMQNLVRKFTRVQ